MLWIAVFAASGVSFAQPMQNSAAGGIDAGSVGRLTLRMAFPTGQRGGHAGAPVVDGDRLFVLTPFPHSVLAFDLAHPDAPVIWRYARRADGAAWGLATRNVTTTGIALSAGRLFLNTFDGHTIALDAATGNALWDVAIAEIDQGGSLLAAPMAAGDRVFIGSNGGDFGVRGWVAALDASSGRVLWRRDNAGPDVDVGVGKNFRSQYLPTEADLGVSSWPPDAWQQGGGDFAGTPIHDAGRGLLVYATGHPAPWNAEQRPGANYFTSGLFARDAVTGAARWFVPINPHDLYGLGAEGSLIPADLRWQGGDRAVLIHPDANGMVYVLDSSSGEILSAHPFVDINATKGVDHGSGTLRRNPDKAIRVNSTTRDICPAWPGATGGTAQAAFSPQTGLCTSRRADCAWTWRRARPASWLGTPYIGTNIRAKAPRDSKGRGALIAWNLVAGKPVWTVEESLPVESGVLVTAGGVVFYGTLDGWFKAVDARSGKPLWQVRAASGIIGQPVSLERADGHQ